MHVASNLQLRWSETAFEFSAAPRAETQQAAFPGRGILMQSFDAPFAVPSQGTAPPSLVQDLNIPFLLGILRRDWLYPAIGLLIGIAAIVTYAVMAPSLYKSSARILIDRSVNRYLQTNKIIDQPVLEDSETGGQLYILSSESIIIPIVRSMKLTRDREFVGAGATDSDDEGGLLSSLKEFIGIAPADRSAEEGKLERLAVETFLKRLTVLREDVQNVISVTFASEDAEKAAAIANAVAEGYIAANRDAKFKSTHLASNMLKERLAELKQQAGDAERVLQDFRIAHNLVSSGKLGGPADQITGLNTQLSLARAAMAEAKSRVELLEEGPRDGVAIARVSDNDVILKLRTQYFEYSARAAEIESRVGPRHSVAIKLNNRLEQLRASIRDEQLRIARSDFQLAKARSEELLSTLSQLAIGNGAGENDAKVKLRELESTADALRSAYDSVLQRFNEVGKNDDTVGQDARIITRAAPPLQKASRKMLIVMAGGLSLGLLLGLGTALGREFMSGVIRTPGQLRQITDAYCAIVPKVGNGADLQSVSASAGVGLLEEHVLQAPFSRFTEALRNVRVILVSRQEPNRGNVVCVASAVPKEGKSIIATNLGAIMASGAKRRVLVIDGDFHWRSLTRKLAPRAREGLLEALEDPSRLSSLVVRRKRAGIDVLPCPVAGRLENAAELLGSPLMEELLLKARDLYDFVIIEAPPIMSVVDIKMIEQHVDQFVLVVEWGETKLRLVQEAMLEVEGVRERLSCVVLNKVDPDALKALDSYKGPRFGDYQSDGVRMAQPAQQWAG